MILGVPVAGKGALNLVLSQDLLRCLHPLTWPVAFKKKL